MAESYHDPLFRRAKAQLELEKKMGPDYKDKYADRPCDTEVDAQLLDHIGRSYISSDPEWPVQQVVQRPEVPPQRTIQETLAEREKTHGSYERQAACCYMMKHEMNLYRRGSFSPQQVEALYMILHKISRIACGDPDFKDHWDDIAGYATLVSRGLK